MHTAVRYGGVVHDFVLLNALRRVPETRRRFSRRAKSIHDRLSPANATQ
jgi:hypothetical protein